MRTVNKFKTYLIFGMLILANVITFFCVLYENFNNEKYSGGVVIISSIAFTCIYVYDLQNRAVIGILLKNGCKCVRIDKSNRVLRIGYYPPLGLKVEIAANETRYDMWCNTIYLTLMDTRWVTKET